MKYYSILDKEPPHDYLVWGYDCYYSGWIVCHRATWGEKHLIGYPHDDDVFITTGQK